MRNILRGALYAVALAALAACSPLGGADVSGRAHRTHASPAGQWAREDEMNRRWRYRPYSELTRALGAPARLLEIPGGGNPPGFVAIYGRDAASGCLDAYAVAAGDDPVVTAHYCR